jgi:hypothetical protein
MSSVFEKTTAGIGGNNNQTSSATTHQPAKYNIGKMVIVRCRDAGVHYGKLIDYYDRTVVLEDSRRMVYWVVAKNETRLSGCARVGIDSSSNICGPIAGPLVLPEFCEILPCTQESIDSFTNQPNESKS